MPETNAESGKKPLSRRVASPPPIVLVLFLLALALGCRTASSPDDSDQASSNRPEITDETVSERLIGSRVWDVPEENGAQEPITWNFDYDEPTRCENELGPSGEESAGALRPNSDRMGTEDRLGASSLGNSRY